LLSQKIINRLSSLFDDKLFRRLLKNASWLSGATFVAGVLGFFSYAITARVLGPASFGIIVVVMTYVTVVDRLLNFQSWQVLIKNGANALKEDDTDRFRRLVKFAALLDLLSAILSTIIAMSLAGVVGAIIGWSEHEVGLAIIYSVTILFHLSGMPTAVLRLYDRFQILAKQKIIMASFNLVGVITVWLLNGNLQAFLLAFALSNIVGNAYLLLMGWLQLKYKSITNIWSSSLSGVRKSEPGIIQFVFYTNVESSVKIIRDFDIFLIKIISSPEAVGLYLMARKIAEAMHMFADSFFHAIYPEYTKLLAAREIIALKNLLKKSSITVGGASVSMWIVFIVLGPLVIPLLFGLAFTKIYLLSVICLIGSVVWAFSQPVAPILYALGHSRDVFMIHILTAITYILLVWWLVNSYDVLGASIAYALFFVLWGGTTSSVTLRRLSSFSWRLK
jgi:O-antigen/teichoic acid export membrane protein